MSVNLLIYFICKHCYISMYLFRRNSWKVYERGQQRHPVPLWVCSVLQKFEYRTTSSCHVSSPVVQRDSIPVEAAQTCQAVPSFLEWSRWCWQKLRDQDDPYRYSPVSTSSSRDTRRWSHSIVDCNNWCCSIQYRGHDRACCFCPVWQFCTRPF